MSKIARDNRNADIAKIQIARKQLAMTEEDYRAMLQGVGGVTSSTALDYEGRQRILAHLQRMGWRPKASTSAAPKRPTPAADKVPLVRRIRAQLISLGRLPDEYADGIAKQMLGVNAPAFFEWCHMDTLYKISQALGVEQHRKGARTHA